jgi:NAD(P)H-quinone oxidoreductase subunit 5
MLSIIWFPGITRKTGPRPAGYINIFMTFCSLVHAIVALTVAWGQPAHLLSFPWLAVGGLKFTLDLQVSTITVVAIVLIAGINLLAGIYAVGYMEMDWGWGRFYALLALFEAGMCSLVLCDSLFFSYVVLEILTLGTYLRCDWCKRCFFNKAYWRFISISWCCWLIPSGWNLEFY